MRSISILAVFALAFSCTLALDVTINQQWKLWKETNNKRYSGVEEHSRYEVIISIYIFSLLTIIF